MDTPRSRSLVMSAVLAVALVASTLGATPASAAPANDTFTSATVLTGARVLRSADTNVGATAEPGEPQHAGQAGGASVWYAWTPAASGPVTISTAGSTVDTLLGVYVGTSVNTLAGVVSNDDDPAHQVLTSVVRFDAVATTTYRIAVDGYAGDQGTIVLRLRQGPPATTRVSVSDLEAEANADSWTSASSDQTTDAGTNAVSDAGSVAFASGATNLISPTADSNACTDVFVRTPVAGTTQRVSISNLAAQANDCSWDPTIATDGTRVAFSSDATNLISPTSDGNGCTDVFLRDLTGLTTQRVSLTNGGAQANDCSQNPALSGDGTAVAFESWATNLTSPAPNGNLHIFVRSLTGATTTQVTKTSGGTQGNNDSYDPAVSSTGRYVAYESRATNLGITDTNGTRDIYLTDTSTGAITRVSVGAGGAQGDAASLDPSISADGRYVAFASDATTFSANDTNGARDVFVHDTLLGTTTRVSVRTNGTQGKGDSYEPQLSADGRFVVFASDAPNLVAGDTNGATDVFVRDLTTGFTSRLSVDAGWNEGGGASFYASISPNASTVAFTSDANDLVAGDTALHTDVFTRPLSYQADALVRRSTAKTSVGDGVYETTATLQKLPVLKVKRGRSATFRVTVEHDGSAVDRVSVLGCGTTKGFTVGYRVGGVDVTAAVLAGTYALGPADPDASVAIDLTIAVSPTVALGRTKACAVTATSATDATKLDQVAVQVRSA
jgi:Tol biopolymer transport system component